MKLEPFESKIGQEFRTVIKGNNFMTPQILGYIQTNKGIAEISTGNKFLDLEMFGVTLVNNNQRCLDLDKNLNSFNNVEKYIDELNYEDKSQLITMLKKL